jgi:hypothetical protein
MERAITPGFTVRFNLFVQKVRNLFIARPSGVFTHQPELSGRKPVLLLKRLVEMR